MSTVGSPSVRKPITKPSILSRLSSASPNAVRPKTTTTIVSRATVAPTSRTSASPLSAPHSKTNRPVFHSNNASFTNNPSALVVGDESGTFAASPVESSLAYDAELHMKHFNDELIRDNELMLQEIEGLRDENDVMFDELRRLRTENALLKEQNLDLQEGINGQNEAFVRLSSEVAKEITITQSLKQIFDNLNANRFDNLFTKRARALHAELGRSLTTKENYTLAKESLAESNKQINSVFEILDSMSKVPNFTTNAKDVLVLDATMQVISLCKLMNSMMVVEKTGKEKEQQLRQQQPNGQPYHAAAAMLTPRSAAAQEKTSGGPISFLKSKFGGTPKQNELEVETLVTVLTARAGDGPRHPAAVQLPNEKIQMPVTAKEVEKRATLMQRLASVFGSSSEGNLTARNLPPRRNTPPPQQQKAGRPVSYSANLASSPKEARQAAGPLPQTNSQLRQTMPVRPQHEDPMASPIVDIAEPNVNDAALEAPATRADSKEVFIDNSPYRTSINQGGEDQPDGPQSPLVAPTAPQLASRPAGRKH